MAFDKKRRSNRTDSMNPGKALLSINVPFVFRISRTDEILNVSCLSMHLEYVAKSQCSCQTANELGRYGYTEHTPGHSCCQRVRQKTPPKHCPPPGDPAKWISRMLWSLHWHKLYRVKMGQSFPRYFTVRIFICTAEEVGSVIQQEISTFHVPLASIFIFLL